LSARPRGKKQDQRKTEIDEDSYEPSSFEYRPEEIEQVSMSREWILHQAIPDKLVDASLKSPQLGHLIDPFGSDDCEIHMADVQNMFLGQVEALKEACTYPKEEGDTERLYR
jgi:hypothetical protein